MGKKTKGKEEGAEEGAEEGKSNGSSDIFKTLFGRDAPEELGLGFGSNPRNVDIEIHRDETNVDLTGLKLKKKRDKGIKPDFDAEKPDKIDEDLEKQKKRKREKEKNLNLDVGSIGKDEVKKIKKEKDKTKVKEANFDVVQIGNNLERNDEDGIVDLKKERRKKKRKRDEIEAEYEAKNYGVIAKVEGQEESNLGKRVVGEKRKTVDDPAEMIVSKEGFDDEIKLLRTIFVGNLPLKLKKKALLKEFRKFGEIESVRIRSVPIKDSKTPRKGAIFKGEINESVDSVNGYIVFKEEKSAQASLSHNMAMVEGNHVRVDMACPPRKKLKGEDAHLYDNKRTVFVGNLPFDVKDEELYQLFCGTNQLQSSIEAVRVIRDPHTSVGKGIAYVLFKTRDAANFVVKKKHMKLRDRDLRLYHAKSDTTPSKKRNPSPSSADGFPAKRSAIASNSGTLSGNGKAKASPLSYQGLRASKSGIQKKEGFRPKSLEQAKQNPETKKRSGVVGKDRKSKRPAVAARKAIALKGGGGGTPRPPGKKRKLESRTPESFQRNKKTRK